MAKSKYININSNALEKAHFLRIERYARLVDEIYRSAIDELTGIVKNVKYDPNKPFSFRDFPGTYQKSLDIFKQMSVNVTAAIIRGEESEWLHAASNNDYLIEQIFGSSRVGRKRLEQYQNRNLEALKSFQSRKTQGMGLSDRVWRQTEQFRQEMELGIDVGLGDGRSASALSRDLRSYLQNPDKLFRRVRDARGQLHLSKAARSFSPGQGVYRSSYKNAMRLARTEINMAYRESDYHRWMELDFVVGIEIRLSNNPNHCPMCAQLAGRYPKDFKFTGWHPNCRCSSVPIMKTQQEMDDDIMRILNDEPILPPDESSNAINGMPAGYNKWMADNNERILTAKSIPYFIRDNYKGGDVGKGLRFVVQETKKQSAFGLDLKEFIKGDVPTNTEMSNIFKKYAEIHPEDFRIGLESISFRKSSSYLMQHSASFQRSTRSWVGKSKFTISTQTFVNGTFNPAEELRGALAAIKRGDNLTFNQEYSIESLWHEILHAKTKTPPRSLTRGQLKAMETVNQFTARHTYDDFLKSLGGKASHKETILNEGFGYKEWVSDFRAKLKGAGISEKAALDELMPVLMADYQKVELEILKLFNKYRK